MEFKSKATKIRNNIWNIPVVPITQGGDLPSHESTFAKYPEFK